MTDFMTVRGMIEPCRTFGQLAQAWNEAQPILRRMEQGSRLALVAMKDFYKGMIERGTIGDYLESRKAASARQWTGTEIHEAPPRPVIHKKKK